jgi:hypothetical protein
VVAVGVAEVVTGVRRMVAEAGIEASRVAWVSG